MPIGWPQFLVGVIGGLVLGLRRGVVVPLAGPGIWWIHGRLSGDFVDVANDTPDEVASIAFVAAVIGVLLGELGVLVGAVIRRVAGIGAGARPPRGGSPSPS